MTTQCSYFIHGKLFNSSSGQDISHLCKFHKNFNTNGNNTFINTLNYVLK